MAAAGHAGPALTPKSPGPDRIFTIFSQPFDGTKVDGVGIDVNQAPAPARALEEARRTGEVTVSDTYLLIRDRNLPEDQRQKSFILGAPVYGAPGSTRASDPMREELTLREAAEAELRAARDHLGAERAYLRQILDALDVAVITCDADGILVHTNRAARVAIPGVDADAGVPLSVVESCRRLRMAHPDGTPFAEHDLPLLVALRGQRVDGVEAHVTHADGHHQVVMMHARPLRDRDGRIMGAVASSYAVTALRQREAELTAFAGIVAHDLRSPLTAIGGFTEFVRDALADGGPGHEHRQEREVLDRTLATTARMRRLIDDLLGYAAARDAVLDARDLDLRAVVDDVVTERLAAQAVDPTSPAAQIFVGAMPSVHADPALLRQLLDNLIGNALKYTPPGQPARVDVCATPHGSGWVRVDVADRGIGIPEGEHDAIFTGFHRAHRTADYAGTGLGLAICQRVVERHGGTIIANDNPGGGARLSFTLPTAQATRFHARSPHVLRSALRLSRGPPRQRDDEAGAGVVRRVGEVAAVRAGELPHDPQPEADRAAVPLPPYPGGQPADRRLRHAPAVVILVRLDQRGRVAVAREAFGLRLILLGGAGRAVDEDDRAVLTGNAGRGGRRRVPASPPARRRAGAREVGESC